MTDGPRTGAASLADCRALIDTIDDRLVALLARRFAVAERIGELKRDAAAPVLDAGREAAILARVTAAAPARFAAPVRDVFAHLFGVSRGLQGRSRRREDGDPSDRQD